MESKIYYKHTEADDIAAAKADKVADQGRWEEFTKDEAAVATSGLPGVEVDNTEIVDETTIQVPEFLNTKNSIPQTTIESISPYSRDNEITTTTEPPTFEPQTTTTEPTRGNESTTTIEPLPTTTEPITPVPQTTTTQPSGITPPTTRTTIS